MCQPKEEGGMGIKNMETMNKAFIMKLAWGVAQGNSLWVRLLKEKYMKFNRGDDYPKAASRDSMLWKAICQVWQKVHQNISWNLGNGKKILFWKDCWLANYGPLINYINGEIPEDKISCTVADMVNARGEWKWEEFAHLIPIQVMMGIAGNIPSGAGYECRHSNMGAIQEWKLHYTNCV
uniref:Reverse transcriptase zinc-binding domain-containing protein n=1 Tax=Salix viminalis TaxID=40686 RepID=A0A6N2KBG0_SALVM